MIGFLEKRNHTRLRTLLSSYIDGQVSGPEAREVEAHLATCDTCRAELDGLRATVGLLRRLPQLDAPRSFALRGAPAQARSTPPIVWTARFATSIAAMLLVALLLGDALGLVNQSRIPSQELAMQAPAAPEALTVAPAPFSARSMAQPTQQPAQPEAQPTQQPAQPTAPPAPTAAAMPAAPSAPAPSAPAPAAPWAAMAAPTPAPADVSALRAAGAEQAAPTPSAEAAVAAAPGEGPPEQTKAFELQQAAAPTAPDAAAETETAIEPSLREGAPAAPLAEGGEPWEATPAPEEGLALPLWQLEAAIGALLLALALVVLLTARRGRRV